MGVVKKGERGRGRGSERERERESVVESADVKLETHELISGCCDSVCVWEAADWDGGSSSHLLLASWTGTGYISILTEASHLLTQLHVEN